MPRVLIVDDSLTVRKVVERILESRELEVLQASLGTEAIERIQRDEPDLVVCDVLLPDKEGYEVCQFVRSDPRFDKTPVLLISGIVNPAVVDRAARVGSAGILRKPFSAEELTVKVRALLGLEADAMRPAPSGSGMTVSGSGTTASAGATAPPPAPIVAAPNGIASPPPARLPERAAPAPPPMVAPTPAPAVAPTPAHTLEGCLTGLAAAEGVSSVVLADRCGQLIGTAGNGVDPATLGALTACLAAASDELGGELGRGALQGLILEHGRGVVLVSAIGEGAVLTLVLDEPAALGKARYYVKKAVPELLAVI